MAAGLLPLLRRLLPSLWALLLVLAPAARAELQLIQSGQDCSPYAFLPDLPRGAFNTAYAFTNGIGDEDHSFEYYIQFDLPEDLLEPEEELVQALLWVYYGYEYVLFGDTTGENGEIQCHEVLEPWDEANLTWNQRPAIGPVFYALPNVSSLGLQWCDVTAQARAWLSGAAPNHGIAITSTQPRVIGYFTFDSTTVSPNFRPTLLLDTFLDLDDDGIDDREDNCPELPNPDQRNADHDALGEACDNCPNVPNDGQQDSDGDGRGDLCEPALADVNGDGVVSYHDREAFDAMLGAQRGEPAYDAFFDLDGDGVIGEADRRLWAPTYWELVLSACGLLGVEPFLLYGGLRLWRRQRAKRRRSE